MVSDVMRQALMDAIDGLNEDQATELLLLAQRMQSLDDDYSLENYDPANDPTVALYDGSSDLESKDPAIGLIDEPTDLSTRYKEILRDEIDPRSGWTQKDKLP